MDKKPGVISYDIKEIDIFALKGEIEKLGVKEVVVYGIGNNGRGTNRLLKQIGINVKYFIDVKANNGLRRFKGCKVVSPEEFIEIYDDEFIIITPSIHEDIVCWMSKKGIPKEKLVMSFYQTEKIDIDYGIDYQKKVYRDVQFCKESINEVKGTFVTIAYNTPEKLLRRAIESVLRQTVRNLKYLFVINGATDNTAQIIAEYAAMDSRISIIDMGENLRWTDTRIINAILDNIEGDYCCQLDSDDYYSSDFFEEAIDIGDKNYADIVCVRTCLFSGDSTFSPLDEGLVYDWHDKFFFNVAHPHSHFIGHEYIMTAYAKSWICSTFWGKLYANKLMRRYLEYLLGLPVEERELYYRLDISMTYRILSMSERIFYSDKVKHYAQYSKKNSTYTLAPIEWLMALWYSYTRIKEEMYLYYPQKKANKYSKEYLKVHLLWMVGRKGMLNGDMNWQLRGRIFEAFREMKEDINFRDILLDEKGYMKSDCKDFYDRICELSTME